MPGKRIDVYSDLDPEIASEIQRDVELLVELERQWTETGSEDAYRKWRELASKTFERARENRRQDAEGESI